MKRFDAEGFRVQEIITKKDRRLIINTGGRDWSGLHEWIRNAYSIISFREVSHPDVTFLIYVIEESNNIGGIL